MTALKQIWRYKNESLQTNVKYRFKRSNEEKEKNLNLYEREEEGTETKAYFDGIDSGYARAIQIIEGRLRL